MDDKNLTNALLDLLKKHKTTEPLTEMEVADEYFTE